MPTLSENDLPRTARGGVKQPAELEEIGWFEPYVPPVEVPPPPKPAPKPKPKPSVFLEIIDRHLRESGVNLPEMTDTAEETATEDADQTETPQPSEASAEPAAEPAPPPRFATATEIVRWLRLIFLAQTHLSDEAAELAAYWVISTYFQSALNVLPSLIVTGDTPQANQVLHALRAFCQKPVLLARLERNHLCMICGFSTLLVFAPHLQKRTADLLSSLTDKRIYHVNGQNCGYYAKSIALYAGESPDIPKIQNAIHIHIPPTNAPPPRAPQCLPTMMEHIPVHLDQYSSRNFREVSHWTWTPSGLSSESAIIAKELGRCIVDAYDLRRKLVDLLKTQDRQRLAVLANTDEAIVVEATRALVLEGREQAYAKEIASAANRIQEARGESGRLRPENVGHILKGLGLPTRRLSQAGNGLRFDRTTVARIHELAAMYMVDVVEDAPAESENLPGAQTAESK